jgi:hypothetical protein
VPHAAHWDMEHTDPVVDPLGHLTHPRRDTVRTRPTSHQSVTTSSVLDWHSSLASHQPQHIVAHTPTALTTYYHGSSMATEVPQDGSDVKAVNESELEMDQDSVEENLSPTSTPLLDDADCMDTPVRAIRRLGQ